MQWTANGATFRALIVGPPPGRLVIHERTATGWEQRAMLTGPQLGEAMAGWAMGRELHARAVAATRHPDAPALSGSTGDAVGDLGTPAPCDQADGAGGAS